MSAAFAHTAVLADQPRNIGPLAEAGRHFGRIAHLLDAVEDLTADREAGAYNPLLATGTTRTQARERCDDALSGLRLAIGELDLERTALTRSLLVNEVDVAVDRTFRQIVREQFGSAGQGDPAGPGSPTGPSIPGGQYGGTGQFDPSGYSQIPGPAGGRPPGQKPSCWDWCDCCDCGGCDCDCGGCGCGCDCCGCDCGGCDC